MTSREFQLASSVAFIFFCRMIGLFMVLPILSLYGMDLEGATLALLGLAIGIYGLSQALLQIPFSLLSDRVGRKPVILGGLLLFFLGSLGASFADTISQLVFFRFLQGMGAIAGTSMALLADQSSEGARARMMALVGIAIGASFILALVLGPVIASFSGLSGVFLFLAVLAFLALIATFYLKEDKDVVMKDGLQESWLKLKQVLRFPGLRFYAGSVFVLHASITSAFLAIPLIFEEQFGFAREDHWWLYLSVFMVALLLMGPFARPSADVLKLKRLYRISVLGMTAVLLCLSLAYVEKYVFFVCLSLFFTFFNLIEALLPSMLSVDVDERYRAAAMGVYSSSQFLGAFTGGAIAGLLLEGFGLAWVFAICAILFGILLAVSWYSSDTFLVPDYSLGKESA